MKTSLLHVLATVITINLTKVAPIISSTRPYDRTNHVNISKNFKTIFQKYSQHPQFYLLLQNLIVWLCIALLMACSQLPLQPNQQNSTNISAIQQLDQQALYAQQHMISVGRLMEQSPLKGSPVDIEQKARSIQNQTVAKYAQQVWIGKRTMALPHDANLPPFFTENISIHFDAPSMHHRVSLTTVAERLSRIAKLAVRLSPDVWESNGFASNSPKQHSQGSAIQLAPNGNADTFATMEIGQAIEINADTKAELDKTKPPKNHSKIKSLPSPSRISYNGNDLLYESKLVENSPSLLSHQMRWEGSLQAYLDHITQLLNLSWRYHQGAVIIERLVTENFELAAFGGSQEYQMGLSGGNQGNSGFGSSSAQLDVQESGKTHPYEELRKSLTAIVSSSGGWVNLNEASGRITVHAPKDVMMKARDIILAEDRQLKRQAHIQLDIYSISQSNQQAYGIDWSVPIQNLAKTWSASIASPVSSLPTQSAGLAYTLLKDIPTSSTSSSSNTAQRYGDSKAFLKALQQTGRTVQYRPISLIAMNRQWARSTSLRVTGYVSETSPSTSSNAGSGAPGLKTASVTTGDKFLVKPAIMDDGTIYLKFGVSLTDLLGLFNVTAGSGDSLQTVQTPETSGTDDQGSIRLQPGEAMVITGLSRQTLAQDQNKIAEPLPLILGGSEKRNYQREDFLIVVRATPL